MQTSSLARPAPSGVTQIPPGGSKLRSRLLREDTRQFLPRKTAKKDNTYILLYTHGKISDKYRIDVTEMVFICQAKF